MIERISNALNFINTDNRDVWLTMGMAIKSELGEGGFDTWLDWSKAGASFNAKDAQDVWKSIRPHGAVTIGSLFHQAKANGWTDNGQRPSSEQLAKLKAVSAARAREQELAIERERAETAQKAKVILSEATVVQSHPYLERKQVKPVSTLKTITVDRAKELLGYSPQSSSELLEGQLLVVPVVREGGLSTLELIDERGRKTALAGRGTRSGGYWATNKFEGGTILIGEGVATVLSAHLATGFTGVAALSADNLPKVAQTIKGRFKDAELVILADIDKNGSPHPKSLQASEFGRLVVPEFQDRQPDQNDFNDLHVAHGLDEVKAAFCKAPKFQKGVSLVRASDINPEPIKWLWNGWLAAGKLHIMAGAPGTGKTTISMAIAATLTTGGCFPDGSPAKQGDVLIWSGEDDPKDTLIPRLMAAGADRTRVHIVDGVVEQGLKRSFDPATDTGKLREVMPANARLIIVDPIVSAIAGDSHKNAEVRRGLQPLVDLAAQYECAILGITHFSKGTGGRDPIERLTGSQAFGALARTVFVAAKHQEEDGESKRIFCKAKSNIASDKGGFEYSLTQIKLDEGIETSAIIWGERLEGSARELLSQAEEFDDDGSNKTDAKRYLKDLLSDGPMLVRDVFRDAEQFGYSKRKMQRTADAIGVEKNKVGMTGPWQWELLTKVPPTSPTYEDATKKPNPVIFGETLIGSEFVKKFGHESAEDATKTCMTPSVVQEPKMPEDARHQTLSPSRLRQEDQTRREL
jgi:putative DNA primase/helicase